MDRHSLCNMEALLMELDILTVEEAAQVLGVEREVVVPLLESNEIAGRLLEGSWRTTRRALASFVDGAALQLSCCPPGSCGPLDESATGRRGCCCC